MAIVCPSMLAEFTEALSECRGHASGHGRVGRRSGGRVMSAAIRHLLVAAAARQPCPVHPRADAGKIPRIAYIATANTAMAGRMAAHSDKASVNSATSTGNDRHRDPRSRWPHRSGTRFGG